MKRIVLVLLVLACMAGTAHASLWELTAKSEAYNVSDFSIVFNVVDETNKVVSFDDVVSFSGVTITTSSTNFYSKLKGLPAKNIDDFTLLQTNLSSSSNFWLFVGISIREHNWSYSVAPVTSATPIPGAAWLLGTGVAGLFGLRRKFRA